MLNERWHPARIGLIDFWYYENQEFELDHGHLLLRGSNGSGKSVTMQSFIPVSYTHLPIRSSRIRNSVIS